MRKQAIFVSSLLIMKHPLGAELVKRVGNPDATVGVLKYSTMKQMVRSNHRREIVHARRVNLNHNNIR